MHKRLKEFEDLLSPQGRKHGLTRVFNDMVTMAVCSYHVVNIQSQCTEQDPDNEASYLEVSKRYNKDELNGFAKAMGILHLNAYENPFSDLLGSYYQEQISKGHNGEFFTPPALSRLMAELTGQESVRDKSVLDPACGTGVLLLNFANLHPFNTFYGAELNQTTAKAAALNMFFNHMSGEIAHMNTLIMEHYQSWLINDDFVGIKPIPKEQSRIWQEIPKQTPPDFDKPPPRPPGEQLVMF